MQLIDPKLIDPNPFQSRQSMDGDDLKLLAEDIKARGLLQPPFHFCTDTQSAKSWPRLRKPN